MRSRTLSKSNLDVIAIKNDPIPMEPYKIWMLSRIPVINSFIPNSNNAEGDNCNACICIIAQPWISFVHISKPISKASYSHLKFCSSHPIMCFFFIYENTFGRIAILLSEIHNEIIMLCKRVAIKIHYENAFCVFFSTKSWFHCVLDLLL